MTEKYSHSAESGNANPDTTPKKELLSKTRVGLQASLLLDGLHPGIGTTLNKDILRQKLQPIKTSIDAEQSPSLPTITSSSKHERDEHWNGENSEHKGKSFQEQKQIWIENTNTFLSKFEGKPEEGILKKLNISVNNGAEAIYIEYFGSGENGHNGEIGYFAHKAATKLKYRELLDQNTLNLLEKIGGFYGKDSAEVARHLAEGIKNIKDTDLDTLVDKAAEQFSKGNAMEGVGIINGIHERNKKWKDKHQGVLQKQVQQQTVGADAVVFSAPNNESSDVGDKPQGGIDVPADSERKKDWHPLIDDFAERTSAKKKLTPEKNEDASFAEATSGTAGVFDGVGSLIYSHEASHTASKYLADELKKVSEYLPLDKTEKAIADALKGARTEIHKKRQIRYRKMIADLNKNLSGELSDEDFEKNYEHENSRIRHLLNIWIREQNRENKVTEITKEQTDDVWEMVEGATTASLVKLWEGEINGEKKKKAIIANIGDSRVYKLREGKLEIVTIDGNNLYGVLGPVEARRIQEARADGPRTAATEEDLYKGKTVLLKAANPLHKAVWDVYDCKFQEDYPFDANGEVEVPYSAIDDSSTEALPGDKYFEPKIQSIDVESGDILLLQTDGVHDDKTTTEIKYILDTYKDDLGAVATALVADNIDDATAVLIKVK